VSTIIVACRTLEDELTLAVAATGVEYPVYWIDSKLHIKPEKLKEQIQATIDRISNVSTIILVFGYCGRGLAGITSPSARLVVPKAEDCISLLLGSQERRTALSKEAVRYYLTRGWIESENNIADEYEYATRKFGEKRGMEIMRAMLKNYRYLSLIDTGGYDTGAYEQKTAQLAEKLGLSFQLLKGSQRFFEKLLTGPWDEEFIVAAPGQAITMDDYSKSSEEDQCSQMR
jgi:hypothetical protein